MVGTEFTGVEPLANSRGEDGVATTVVVDSGSSRDGKDGHFGDHRVPFSDKKGTVKLSSWRLRTLQSINSPRRLRRRV